MYYYVNNTTRNALYKATTSILERNKDGYLSDILLFLCIIAVKYDLIILSKFLLQTVVIKSYLI